MKKTLLATYDMPPPPPQLPSKGSSKKLIAIIAIVVVVVAVVAGALILMNQGGNNQPQTTNTPSASSSTSPSPTTSPTSTTGLSGASSIRFCFDVTTTEAPTEKMTYEWSAKNIGTQNMMMRIEMTSTEDEGSVIIIVNGEQEKSWMGMDDYWMDTSEYFQDDWESWQETWLSMETDLAEWTGMGEWTYTDLDGNTIRVYNAEINPSLPDSLFVHVE